MSITKFNKDARRITTSFHAGFDGQFLEISTSHDKERKQIRTTVSRVVNDGIFMTWHMDLRNEDPNPITPGERFPVARYSAKVLEEAHAEFLSRHVYGVGQLEQHTSWAARAKK